MRWPLLGFAITLAMPALVWAQPLPDAVGTAFGLLQADRVPEAVAAFEAAIVEFPDLTEARLGLAIALRRAGDDTAAWDAYQAALRLDPDNILALETVGLLGTFRSRVADSGDYCPQPSARATARQP
ncbi:MAG: tetratricopeptide repeat protein [Synechococcaceae cyanobacterium SM2_3_60]|nr:tetratricopeptide repeat protein [Synechococcaceae cyanobacterium SM2_3_60]